LKCIDGMFSAPIKAAGLDHPRKTLRGLRHRAADRRQRSLRPDASAGKIGTGIILGIFSACPDLLKKQGLRLRDVADVPLKPQRRTEVRRLDMMVSLGELLIPAE